VEHRLFTVPLHAAGILFTSRECLDDDDQPATAPLRDVMTPLFGRPSAPGCEGVADEAVR
jgi:hypothetical protein